MPAEASPALAPLEVALSPPCVSCGPHTLRQACTCALRPSHHPGHFLLHPSPVGPRGGGEVGSRQPEKWAKVWPTSSLSPPHVPLAHRLPFRGTWSPLEHVCVFLISLRNRVGGSHGVWGYQPRSRCIWFHSCHGLDSVSASPGWRLS